jgi:hypothetical protein
MFPGLVVKMWIQHQSNVLAADIPRDSRLYRPISALLHDPAKTDSGNVRLRKEGLFQF